MLASIQRLRARAKLNGYLVDNQAQKIEEENGKIVIASAMPRVVYVPIYDSEAVYATPATAPPSY